MNDNIVCKKYLDRATFLVLSTSFLVLGSLLLTSPALAHHPNGGKIPSTFIEGFLSGLGHPVIGIDHFVFVIAIGLVAALSNKLGMVIPLAFMAATAIGTGIHLQSINLPLPELFISASVLGIGIFLAQEKPTNLVIVTIIGAIALMANWIEQKPKRYAPKASISAPTMDSP